MIIENNIIRNFKPLKKEEYNFDSEVGELID